MNKEIIKEYRFRLGLSQTKMAKLLHLKLRQYQSYEAGTAKINAAIAELLLYKIKYGELE